MTVKVGKTEFFNGWTWTWFFHDWMGHGFLKGFKELWRTNFKDFCNSWLYEQAFNIDLQGLFEITGTLDMNVLKVEVDTDFWSI